MSSLSSADAPWSGRTRTETRCARTPITACGWRARPAQHQYIIVSPKRPDASSHFPFSAVPVCVASSRARVGRADGRPTGRPDDAIEPLLATMHIMLNATLCTDRCRSNCKTYILPSSSCYNPAQRYPADPQWGQADIYDDLINATHVNRSFFATRNEVAGIEPMDCTSP